MIKLKNYMNMFSAAYEYIDEEQIELICTFLSMAKKTQKHLFFIGNGGSSCNAGHFAQDISTQCHSLLDSPSKRFKAISLCDNISTILAYENDLSHKEIFTQQLMNLGTQNDILFVFSGSGMSENIIDCVKWALNNGLQVISIVGFNGGLLKLINNPNHHVIHIGINNMGIYETITSLIFHLIVERFMPNK